MAICLFLDDTASPEKYRSAIRPSALAIWFTMLLVDWAHSIVQRRPRSWQPEGMFWHSARRSPRQFTSWLRAMLACKNAPKQQQRQTHVKRATCLSCSSLGQGEAEARRHTKITLSFYFEKPISSFTCPRLANVIGSCSSTTDLSCCQTFEEDVLMRVASQHRSEVVVLFVVFTPTLFRDGWMWHC